MRRRRDVFPRVGRLHKGYSRRQVNALLESIDQALAKARPDVSARDVRRAGFYLVRNGYDTQAVDAALDDLEARVRDAALAAGGEPERSYAVHELAALGRQLDQPAGSRFPRVSRWRRGHDPDEVDALIAAVLHALPEHRGVAIDDLRGATFRLRRRGYHRRSVDEMLDRLIEVLLRSRAVDVSSGRPDVDVRPVEGSHKVADAL